MTNYVSLLPSSLVLAFACHYITHPIRGLYRHPIPIDRRNLTHLMSRALIIPSSSATGCHSQMDGSNQGCHSQMDESNQGFQFHYEQYILIQEKVFNFIMNDTY